MTDDTNHPAEDEPSAENKTPTSRRTFMKAAGASAGTYALGTSAASAQDVPELTVDLADDEIGVGETTTATFTIENVPEGSSGASIDIALDADVAAIVEIQDNSFARTINDEIERDYDGAAPSLGFGDAGGISSGDVLGTLVIEGQSDGDTALELTDFSLTDADSNVINTVDYVEPTLTVGDGGGSGGVSAPASVDVVETGETWIDLEWSAVDGAASYNVYVDGVLEAETTSTATTVPDLESGETYEIAVTALGDGEESDQTTVMAMTDGGDATPAITVSPADTQLEAGDQTTVDLALEPASDGLYGFAFELQFDGDVVSAVDAEIGSRFPDEDDILTQVDVGDDYVDLRSQQAIDPTDSSVTLGQVTLEADSEGRTDLDVDVGMMTDYDDNDFMPEIRAASLTVGDTDTVPPTVTIDAADEIGVGAQTTVDLALEPGSDGLYGFAAELQFDGDVVSAVDAEIGEQFPGEDDILTQIDVGDDYVDIRSQESIAPTESSIPLGQVTLEGDSQGSTDLEVDPGFFTDYDDEDFTPETESATLSVGEGEGAPTVTIDAADQIDVGETTTVDLELDPASDGLYGFAFELQFDGDVVSATDAEIGGQFPGEDDILTQVDVGDDYVDFRSQEAIEPTDSSVTLGQVTLEGDTNGETDLEVDPGFFTDYDDEDFTPATESASLTVGEIDVGPTTITVDVDETDIDAGETTTVDLALDPASEGLYGFAFELQLDGGTVTPVDAEIGEQFPGEDDILTQIDVGDDYVDFRSQEAIEPTDSAVQLGQVTLEGDGEGPTTLEVDPGFFTDYDDEDFTPETESATIAVGGVTPPQTVTVDVSDSEIETGEQTTVDLALDPASDGLYGFATELQFDGNVVSAVDAEIGSQFPDESDILTQVDVGDDYVDFRSQEAIEPTGSAVHLGQVTLEGDAGGETDLDADIGFFTDYDDNDFEPAAGSATLVVDGEELPDPPENLSVDSTGESSITVSWTGDASEYNVYVDGDFESSTSSTSETISGLESDTSYRIGVASVANGTESSTETVTATTDEETTTGEYQQWESDVLYQRGERVSWNGEDWEAKWTNRGEEPEYDVRGAWEPLNGEIPLQQDLVDIEASPTSTGTGERVEFRALDTSADTAWIENLEWDFGDGTTASGWWNAHTYSSSGTYTVTLTATDQRGRQSTAQVQITVS